MRGEREEGKLFRHEQGEKQTESCCLCLHSGPLNYVSHLLNTYYVPGSEEGFHKHHPI